MPFSTLFTTTKTIAKKDKKDHEGNHKYQETMAKKVGTKTKKPKHARDKVPNDRGKHNPSAQHHNTTTSLARNDQIRLNTMAQMTTTGYNSR